MNRRFLVLAALTLVALSSVTGVGSVSSVSADRDVSVAVAEDDEAYLGLEFGTVDNGTRTLTVANRISTEPTVVTIEDADGADSQTLGPGETATFDVSCDDEIQLSAVAPNAEVDATRSVECPVDAGGEPSDDRTNNGQCGNSGANGESGENTECGQNVASGSSEPGNRERATTEDGTGTDGDQSQHDNG
ncbi:hypothetical protein [Salinigranum halophilum]|uniref:hypothetical protein n=1 Tax=Salinigranum halophilum TaxID=2565931 RepID=UPI0010A9143C|nr:hypothetical protein [Salinigranum halophilum]